MLSTQSLREHLDQYAAGAMSAEALEEWLAAESWDMRRVAPAGLQHLVESVQSMFIQYSDGQITADQFRDYLLGRRDQLHRAAETTEQLKKQRVALENAIQRARQSRDQSISDTQALPLTLLPAV